VATKLDGTIDVTQVFSTHYAFTALRADGSVVTWGDADYGGDSSAVSSQLHDVVSMANPFTNDVFTDTPPTASNRTITTNEDTARALAAADFVLWMWTPATPCSQSPSPASRPPAACS
jgi:hypothetical protein